jgi:hypothetical protein
MVGACFRAYQNAGDGLKLLFSKLAWDKKQLLVGTYWGADVVHKHDIAKAYFKMTLELGALENSLRNKYFQTHFLLTAIL